MSSVLDNIKKNDNNFSFISTFFDLVGNKEFKDAEISTLYTNAETSETSIWRALSAVAEQLGSTFYSNTLNFIDNVTNIDLCKTQQLQSMISLLGVKYTVFNDVQFMPLDILNLIDIFSVKREQLTSTVKMNSDFVNKMLSGASTIEYVDIYDGVDNVAQSKMIDEAEYLSCAQSNVSVINEYRNLYAVIDSTLSDFWTERLSCLTAIDDNKFDIYMSSVYKTALLNKLCASYNNKMRHIIYEQLSDNILLSDFALPNDAEEKINSYKLLYSIPLSFNVQNEVDKYENGEVELSDYTNYLISVLQMEIDRRKAPYINEEPKTRYKFYREREVREYAKFIENEYSVVQLTQNSVGTRTMPGGYYAENIQYVLDPNYIELYNLPQEQLSVISLYKTFIKDKNGKIIVNMQVVNKIALKLVEITNGIRESRELLKMQCQKYFMRGTKLLLNAIVSEYLRSNIVNTLAEVSCLDKASYVFENDNNFIDVVEYIDPTNYYNISTDTDGLLSASIADDISSLNKPFWKTNSSLNAIGAVDGTNLFTKLPTIEAQNFIFNDASMSAFYNGILENKFSIQDSFLSTLLDLLKDFLAHLFELGADNTFLSNDVFHTYDSYTAKNEYDAIVKLNEEKYSLITDHYDSVLSLLTTPYESPLSVLSDAVDLTKSLDLQLSIIYDVLLDNWSEGSDKIQDVEALSNALVSCNEIKEEIALSSLSALLSGKYVLLNLVKQEAYEYALKTDSYPMQVAYNKMLDDYTAGYETLSTLFDAIVSAGYIPDDFKQENLTLEQQLSSLCLCLSSLPEEVLPAAVKAVEDLSTTLSSINKLSAVVELEIMLETLSTLFDEELGYKRTELDVLRSSDLFKSREKIFNLYSGTDNALTPFYNMSNARHPSYMLHPCLSNYVETEEYDYDIDNIANLLNADESKKYMAQHLSDLMDEDGYLINVWQNPLNSNTDYMSKYEQVSHRTVNGTESEVIGYDGLFYPAALSDFLDIEKTFPYDLSKWNLVVDKGSSETMLNGTFEESLRGKRCYNTLTGLYLYVIWNPWYLHLDLSENEANHIADLLHRYKAYIANIAYNSYDNYDIYRYGLDAFNNSYILVKSGTKELDEDEKLKVGGSLWIKINNHPIALPAYEYNYQSGKITSFNECEQIEANSPNFIKELSAIEPITIGELRCTHKMQVEGQPTIVEEKYTYKMPAFEDFTFSNNGNAIVLNGKMKDISASYPLIANVDLYYNYDTKVDRTQYFNNILDIKNPVYSIIPLTAIETQLSGWSFNTYFYDEDKLGVIYSKISSVEDPDVAGQISNAISVIGAYYNILDDNVKQKMMNAVEVDNIITYEEPLENVCIDVNGKTMTVAYLDSLPYNLCNYIEHSIKLDKISALYGYDNEAPYLSSVSIKTKEYELGTRSFLITKTKSYAKYTDAGFFGLVGTGNDDSSNWLGDTNIATSEMPLRGVYKFLILADATPISNMIDYRQILLVRPYENYRPDGVLSANTPQGTVFYPLTYMSAHFYEAMNSETTKDMLNYGIISSESDVFDPFAFRNILYSKEPALKIDENYIDTVKSLGNILSDGYPYFVSADVDTFALPWGLNSHRAEDKQVYFGNCLMQFNEVNTFPMLSIQWARWKTSGSPANAPLDKILLDFNPMYNALSGNKNALSINIYNNMKLFLNLNKAGESGLLNIYRDPLNGDFTRLATYYIKNLSDDKPKFMISADFAIDTAYPALVIDYDTIDGTTVKDAILLSEDENTTTVLAYEQKQLKI